jgi:hypothetical protein
VKPPFRLISCGAAFDDQNLAAALWKVAGGAFKADRLPFSEIEFIEEGEAGS